MTMHWDGEDLRPETAGGSPLFFCQLGIVFHFMEVYRTVDEKREKGQTGKLNIRLGSSIRDSNRV